MSAKTVHNGRDITRLLEHNHCIVRNGKGSHRVAQLPNGQTFTYYEHGEYPKGTLMKFIKILRAVGLLILAGCVYLVFAGVLP